MCNCRQKRHTNPSHCLMERGIRICGLTNAWEKRGGFYRGGDISRDLIAVNGTKVPKTTKCDSRPIHRRRLPAAPRVYRNHQRVREGERKRGDWEIF